MKLYQKQLNNLDELQREKIRLRYQRMHLDKLHSETNEAKNGTAAGTGVLGTLLGLAGNSGGLDTAIEIGSHLVGQIRRKRQKRKMEAAFGAFPKPKSTSRKIAEDIFWSYLVGKAVRTSFGMLKETMKRRKGPLR